MTAEAIDMTEEVRTVLVRIDERTERTELQVEKLTHVILEGNGTPAITVQLATLALKVASLENVTPDVAVRLATLSLEVVALKENARENKIPRHVWIGIVISTAVSVAAILASVI